MKKLLLIGILLNPSFFVFADFKNELPTNFPVVSDELVHKENNKDKNTKNNNQDKNTTNKSHQKHILKLGKSKQESAIKNSSNNKQDGVNQDIGYHNSNAPIFFSGKYGEGSRKTGVLNLVGDAVIIQDDTTLKSNKAQLFAQPGSMPTSGGSRVKKALASGNVRVFKKVSASAPEIKAVGDEAEFLAQERILFLRGEAKVWRGEEYVNAEIIEIHLNTGEIKLTQPVGTIDPKNYGNTSIPNK